MKEKELSNLLSQAENFAEEGKWDTAVSILSKILDQTQPNERNQETREIRLQALADKCRLLVRLGHYDEGFELSRQYYDEAPDYQQRHMALLRMGAHAYHSGHNREAMKAYRTVIELADAAGNRRGYAAGLSSLASVYASSGQLYEAIDYFQEAIALFAQLDDVDGQSGAWNRLGLAYQHIGRLSQAIDAHRRYLRFIQTSDADDNAYLHMTALNNLGENYLFLYDLSTAQDYFQQALAAGDPHLFPDIAADLHRNQGLVLRLEGEHEQGLAQLRLAREIAEDSGEVSIISQALYSLALAELEVGETESGYKHARNLLAIAGQMRARHRYAAALHAFGRYHALNDDPVSALEQYQQAADLAEKVNQRLLLYQIYADMARSARTPSNAHAYWHEAGEIIEQIAERITDPALRRTFLQAGPIQDILRHRSD